jgi:hypothetical protein
MKSAHHRKQNGTSLALTSATRGTDGDEGMPGLGLAKKGLPWPYIITPQSESEARCGKATLLTEGQIHTIVGALKGSHKWNDTELVAKLEELATH